MTDESHDEVSEHIESLLREMTSTDLDLIDPPADLWSRIEAELADDSPPAGAEIIPFRRPLSQRLMLGVTATAAAVVLVIGFAVVASRDGADSTVLAAADLVYDPDNFDALGRDADATVSLVDVRGTLSIDIDHAALPDPNAEEAADLELWLIQPDADGNPADLVSLGVIDPDELGTFEIPESYDPDVFSVVDISIEPRDGVPTHSGRSILRGSLTDI